MNSDGPSPPCLCARGFSRPRDGAACAAAGTEEWRALFSISGGGTLRAAREGDAEVLEGEAIPDGATVTFTALPDLGRRLTRWGGACAGVAASAPVCELAVTMDVTVAAAFGCLDFHGAARDGDAAGLACNLDAGADVNAPDDSGWTPLHHAAFHGRAFALALLLGRGANANALNDRTETPLRLAWDSDSGRFHSNGDGGRAVFAALTAQGGHWGTECAGEATPNSDGPVPPCVEERRALFSISGGGTLRAAREGDAEVLEGEAIPDGATVTFTALPDLGRRLTRWGGACAGVAASAPVCELAVTMDVTVAAAFGCLDFHGAARDGDAAGLACNLDAGADVNAPDDSGWTPLHHAAFRGHLGAVSLLLGRAGTNVNARNNAGETPMTLAWDSDAGRFHSNGGGGRAVFALLAAKGGHWGTECAGETLNPDGPVPPCRLAENGDTCDKVFDGDWLDLSDEHGAGAGVCSGIDINDTFCLTGSGSALSCRGLFYHVQICNLLNRPALDPFHCAQICANGRAMGAKCL